MEKNRKEKKRTALEDKALECGQRKETNHATWIHSKSQLSNLHRSNSPYMHSILLNKRSLLIAEHRIPVC